MQQIMKAKIRAKQVNTEDEKYLFKDYLSHLNLRERACRWFLSKTKLLLKSNKWQGKANNGRKATDHFFTENDKSIQPQSETVISKIRAHSGCFLVFFFETIFYQGRLHTITFKLLATRINWNWNINYQLDGT
jgi:hypothetical protein